MADLNIKNNRYYKRAVFPKGGQGDFLRETQAFLNLNSKEFAELAGVNIRSMNDWKREKYSMSLPALRRICRKRRIPIPKNIDTRDPFWYTSYGSSAGAMAVLKKYGRIGGDPEYRKKRWYEWWEKEGRFKKHPIINVSLPVRIPRKSPELAEFIGIVLGDGSITSKQVTITLHKFDDRYFIDHVSSLFQKLFKLHPSIYKRRGENVASIVASRKELVRFMLEMGLKIGGKVRQQVGVPYWIEESELFTKSCLMGLFDTDGCFYVDRHLYKNKIYLNCCMNFTNRSLPILGFFKDNLKRLGFHPTQRTKFSIFLRKERDVIRYFDEIGSSNPKHLKKFEKYFLNKHGEVPKWS